MTDKIKNSYHTSKNFYDDILSKKKWWSKLYLKLFWGNTDDTKIAQNMLNYIPDNFSGKLLDVPVGTAVFTAEKYSRLKNANITCIDYSQDMLEKAENRFHKKGLNNIKIMQGDVTCLPFETESFDIIICMNGLHAFPDKEKAYSEIFRVLKKDGIFIASLYVAGELKSSDWLVKNILARKGWFSPPFETKEEVKQRLTHKYIILDFHIDGAMLYFRAKKVKEDIF